ncbi:MAG: helix-turn-helix transcriptional regulator [Clostridia bacterium]|nr:helix-turn-helix transcriptional regulator [Clostridia bacterium]
MTNDKIKDEKMEARRKVANALATEYDNFFVRNENQTVYVRTEPYTEFIAVKQGSVKITENGNTVTVNAGEIGIINAFAIHSLTPSPDSVVIGVLFGGEYLADFSRKMPDYEFSTVVNVDLRSELCHIIEEISLRIDEIDFFEKKAYVNFMISRIVKNDSIRKSERSANAKVSTIIRYIYENSEKDISLKTIAEEFGYVPMTVSHIFSKYVGKDLRRFTNEIRIRKAAFLLAKDNGRKQSIAEVARAVGFKSVATFHRIYKEYYGTSPRGEIVSNPDEE